MKQVRSSSDRPLTGSSKAGRQVKDCALGQIICDDLASGIAQGLGQIKSGPPIQLSSAPGSSRWSAQKHIVLRLEILIKHSHTWATATRKVRSRQIRELQQYEREQTHHHTISGSQQEIYLGGAKAGQSRDLRRGSTYWAALGSKCHSKKVRPRTFTTAIPSSLSTSFRR